MVRKLTTAERRKLRDAREREQAMGGAARNDGAAPRLWPPRATWLAVVALALAVSAAYANTLRNPFIFDDRMSIVDNTTIRSWQPPWQPFCPPAHGEAVQRRPLANASLALNYAVSGYQVWSYHLFNIAAHLGAVLLLFGILRRTLLLPQWRERWQAVATPLAFTAALLWAVHPLLTEAVTYIVQRTEVLAGLFYLATLYGLLRGATSARPAWWYAAAVLACAAAMGSKEAAVSAPLMALLYDRVFLSPSWREVFRRRWGLYVGLAATWIIVLLELPHGDDATVRVTQVSQVVNYALAQFGVITHYLRLCFWPHPLVVDYGVYTAQHTQHVLPYALFIGGLAAASIIAFRYQPWLGFLGVLFFAVLAPSSSVLPLLQQIAAEKRMYLPSAVVVTLTVLAGYGLAQRLIARGRLSLRTARIGGTALIVGLAVTLAALTIQRNRAYGDELTVWQNAAAVLPNNARAQNNLGAMLFDAGNAIGAMEYYRRALQIEPDYTDANRNLGNALVTEGQLDAALAHYQKVLARSPHDPETHYRMGGALVKQRRLDEAAEHYRQALAARPDWQQAHDVLSLLLLEQGQLPEAIVHFKEALRLKPDDAEICHNLANALADNGQLDDAIVYYQQALQLQPADANTHFNLAATLTQRGRYREAAAQYRQALQLQPRAADACNNLARLLAACPDAAVRNGAEAVALAQQAVALSDKRNALFLDTLAAAYAEAGDFTAAVQTARQAAALAEQEKQSALAQAIAARLRIYETKTPWREKTHE